MLFITGKKYNIPKSTMQDYAKGTCLYKHNNICDYFFLIFKLTCYNGSG